MGDANAIIEEHKRLVTNLVDSAQQFANSLPQKVDEIKGTVMQYVPNADTANNLLNTIRGYVEDQSPPGESADLYKNLLTNYLWVGVCLFAAALVNVLVGRVYVPVVGLLIGGGGVFLVSFFVLPYLMIEYLPTKIEGSDDDRRMYLLLMGVVDYLTFMVLVAGTWVPFYAPPCFLMPILIGVLSDAVGPSVGSQPRTVFLGIVLGVPAVVYFIFGASMYSLTGMYFLWVLVLTAACLIDVQMKISILKGKGADVSSQSVSLVIVLLTTFVMTYLCSGTEERSSE